MADLRELLWDLRQHRVDPESESSARHAEDSLIDNTAKVHPPAQARGRRGVTHGRR